MKKKYDKVTFFIVYLEVFTDEDDDVFTTVDTRKWRERERPPDEYAKSTQIKYTWVIVSVVF